MRLGAGRVLLSVTAGALVLNLVARTSTSPWLALASAAVLVLPAVSVVLRPGLRQLVLEQRQTSRVVAGQQVEVRVTLRNTGRRASPPVVWTHQHPAFSDVELELPGLLPGEQHEHQVQRTALRRGVFTNGERGERSTLSTTAPFGVIRWTVICPPRGEVIVHPLTNVTPVRQAGLSAALSSHSVATAGTGTEVLGLRHWRQGDSLREVSARATARHGRPVVLQRQRDAGPALVILAEGGGFGQEWERSVAAAASLALVALEVGQPPWIVAEPPPQRRDALGLLDFFAGVDAASQLTDPQITAAARRVGRGGTLALLTPPTEVTRIRHVQTVARAAGARCEVLDG